MQLAPDWDIIRVAVPLRAAERPAGRGDEHRRPAAAALHRRPRAQRRGAGRLFGRLQPAVLADHLDLGRPDGRGRDGRRAEPRRRPAGSRVERAVAVDGAHRPAARRRRSALVFLLVPRAAARHLRHDRDHASSRWACSCCACSASPGLFVDARARPHRRPAGHRRYAQPVLHLARLAGGACRSAAAACSSRCARPLQPLDIWLAILARPLHPLHCCRSSASARASGARSTSTSSPPSARQPSSRSKRVPTASVSKADRFVFRSLRSFDFRRRSLAATSTTPPPRRRATGAAGAAAAAPAAARRAAMPCRCTKRRGRAI